MIIELPKNVRFILAELRKNGFEGYAVGGCVRDSLLGRIPGDWDITTNASPEETKQIFRHTVDTGIEHGTVTVLIYPPEKGSPEGFEVTTYRIDGAYKDGRHPESVTFTKSLGEDLRRRDFTINAMAYNEEEGLVDLFSGKEDLKDGVIRCVGDPDERFDEDALRILRAVRFASQLGFQIEERTAEAIRRHAKCLEAVSRERIFAEINKLICSKNIEAFGLLGELSLTENIAPGFEKLEELPLSVRLPEIPSDRKYMRYALLMRNMEEPEVKAVLSELRSDNGTRDHTVLLTRYLYDPLPVDRYGLKCVLGCMEPDDMRDLFELKKILCDTAEYRERCAGEDLGLSEKIFEEILRRHEPVYMKDLVVTGNDLIRSGVPKGPVIGRILSSMLDDVRRDEQHNSVLWLFTAHLGDRKFRGGWNRP